MNRIAINAIALLALAQPAVAGPKQEQPANLFAGVVEAMSGSAQADAAAPQQVTGRGSAALDANGNLGFLIAKHAATHNVPASLIRRVIKRESRGNPRAVSKGNYGLMQIRLGTARAMGYRGSAAGLLDADTNMTYAVKYLAGAYRVAGGNHDGAVRLYATGYYYAAKRKGLANRDGTLKPPANASAPTTSRSFTNASAF